MMAGTWNGQRREDNGQFGSTIYPKDDVVLDNDKYNEWDMSGFDRESAEEWKTHSFSPLEATDWISFSFTPVDADQWGEYFSPDVADHWRSNGFSYEEAVEWHEFFSPDDAQRWSLAGFTPGQAEAWTAENFNTDEAEEWRDAGFDDPEQEFVSVWTALGLTPDAAASYRDSGLKISSVAIEIPVDAPDLLNRQSPRSFEDEAEEWEQDDFLRTEAQKLVELGFSLRAANAWRRAKVSPENAATWRERIFMDESWE